MGRRRKGEPGSGGEAALPSVYEGPEVLSELLQRAGSPFRTPEVAERFRQAQAAREDRSDVIPALFDEEPHFASPEEARRLYGNLFALWMRVATGLSTEADVPAATPVPTPVAARPLPERGAARGSQLTPPLVEAVWKYVDSLAERERKRLRDRFENAQPDLVAWLDAVPLPEEGALAAQDLAFETWVMFDVAFGDRAGAASFDDLRALAAEPPPLESSQPALAVYVTEALDLVTEEDATFAAAPRAQVERVVATVAAALGEALAAEEDA
jgi:hypothetical protein